MPVSAYGHDQSGACPSRFLAGPGSPGEGAGADTVPGRPVNGGLSEIPESSVDTVDARRMKPPEPPLRRRRQKGFGARPRLNQVMASAAPDGRVDIRQQTRERPRRSLGGGPGAQGGCRCRDLRSGQ